MAREHLHGVGRISAAMAGAPGAAVLASLAFAAVLPVSGDVRLLIAVLATVPAITAAACLALLARSGGWAWIGSVVVAAVSSAVLVLS